MIVERAAGCTAERVGDRVLVLDADARHLTTLNVVGSLLWDALDGTRGTDELVTEIERRLVPPAPSPEQIRADVERFTAELLGHGLVVAVDAPG